MTVETGRLQFLQKYFNTFRRWRATSVEGKEQVYWNQKKNRPKFLSLGLREIVFENVAVGREEWQKIH